MTHPTVLMVLMMMAATATGVSQSSSEENELDYGYWNYREGADNVNVVAVRSVTRVLDAWGKRIFNEIKTLLHSQPSSLLPDYSRVRPLSESVNDLFREVSLMHRRINELTHRLATLEPFLRRHGYRGEGEEEAAARGGGGGGGAAALQQQQQQGPRGISSNTVVRGHHAARFPMKHPPRTAVMAKLTPPKGMRVVRRKRVRVFRDGTGARVVQSGR